MKRFTMLLVALLTATCALAYNYEGCSYRLGVFFSSDADAFTVANATTNIDYQLAQPFYMHLIIISTPVWLSAYEMKLEGLPSSFVVQWIPLAGTGWINVGDETNHIAAFGFPRPNPGGVTHLGRWRVNPFVSTIVPFEVHIGPSVPSSIGGDGPAIVVAGELWRTNFTPMYVWGSYTDFSGCYEPLQPGVFPPYVATGYGPGVTVFHVVAVEPQTLSAVKHLFR